MFIVHFSSTSVSPLFTFAVTFLYCWCMPLELAVLIAVPIQKTVTTPYKMSNNSVSNDLTSLERKLGLFVWWHHILGWEKMFYNPCFRSRTAISCVHSLLRKPENMRFQSEDASLFVSVWTDKKPAGLLEVCHTHFCWLLWRLHPVLCTLNMSLPLFTQQRTPHQPWNGWATGLFF